MESKRAIIAVVLSLIVLLGWTQFYKPKQPSAPVQETQERAPKTAGTEEKTSVPSTDQDAVVKTAPAKEIPAQENNCQAIRSNH